MNESIGAKLQQARELRRLSLQEVSETTKIRSHYLQALENNDISAMPSAAQARGFLRIYVEFLGLDLAELIPAEGQTDSTTTRTESIDSARIVKEETTPKSGSAPGPSLISALRSRLSKRTRQSAVETAAATTGSAAPTTARTAAAEMPDAEPGKPAVGDDIGTGKKKAGN